MYTTFYSNVAGLGLESFSTANLQTRPGGCLRIISVVLKDTLTKRVPLFRTEIYFKQVSQISQNFKTSQISQKNTCVKVSS